jgi:hypothetical protein
MAEAGQEGRLTRQRLSGGMCSIRLTCSAMSSRVWDRLRRRVEGGCLPRDTPLRHSVAGRIGRGTKPPPQLGQTLCKVCSAHSAQNVHSYEQMRANADSGGRPLSQYSQFGRSSKAIAHHLPL